MMKKFLGILLPVVTIIIFILFLVSGSFLKQPFGHSDDVMNYVNELENNISTEAWEDAKINVELLERAWVKVEKRVQYNTEKVNLIGIRTSIAKIRGAISAQDISEGYVALELVKSYWKHLKQ